MIVDVHVHPALFSDICTNKERMNKRMNEMGYDLMGEVDLSVIDKQNKYAEIDKMVLLPLDHSTICGEVILSNEEIKKLVNIRPNQFVGFASVDPHREDALEVLDHAFGTLGLSGLKLNPSKQRFNPDDEEFFPIYKKCLEYNKPIIFHAGLSWEPNTLSEYSHPLRFEKVALTFPELRICLSHFGWPWVQETAMLLIKYPNVYTDTAAMYMDSPELFFDKIFNHDMGRYWLDHNFSNQVMFGSNAPRFRPVRIKRGLDSIEMSDDTRRKLYGENAMRFLGLEVQE